MAEPKKLDKIKMWLKKVGWVGFLFFFFKGMAWLLVPWLIAKGWLS